MSCAFSLLVGSLLMVGLPRLIKESIFIRVNNPTLNRNIGRFQLSHIWDRVLFGTPGIKSSHSTRECAA